MNLHNDTAVNVVALLREPIGSTRTYGLMLDKFVLADDLTATDVVGNVRLTRLGDGILATIRVAGDVELECMRCLRQYDQPFETTFDAQFQATFDVRTGVEMTGNADDDGDEERFAIDENHELDFAEPLRQEILVALPMRPVCGDDCPGPESLEFGEPIERENPFAALGKLLDDDDSSAKG